ncbi:ABC transporter permease [Paenibacillus alkalitolerans]|uniref:ABC transporter permease n=1 Tax=Paenibacillus alkalitolerans TaxID=2799335 RepID=UPI0018F56D3C|nr:ABC transporter permease subunit [Paenibacillus alkalitolerans]
MNKTLLSGVLITAFMLVIAVWGPSVAPYDLDYRAKIDFIVKEDGTSDLLAPPVPPGALFPFGTDKWGADIMTQLLYGAKFTILLSLVIAFARVGFGGFLGMFLGYAGQKRKPWPLWSVLNGIPLFMIVWFIMAGISFNSPLPPNALTLILAVVMVVIGLPSVVSTVKEKAIEIKQRPFVLASRSLGAGHWKIVKTHLFPHLKESLLILLLNEIILTLTLFGQLALFNIFVGGTIVYPDPVEYHSATKEWAGLIGMAKSSIYANKWMLFIPLAAYALLILGFYCISKGLESIYRGKYNKTAHV